MLKVTPVVSGAIARSDSEHRSRANADAPQISLVDPPLPLNNGVEFCLSSEQVREWQELYPAVDVMQELRNMRGWCIANPKKRKTAKGILRFVNHWLETEQNNPRRKGNGRATRKTAWEVIRDSEPDKSAE